MKIVYTLFLLLALSFNAQAQNATNQVESSEKSTRVKNILSLKVGITDPLLAVVYERLFTPYLSAELAVGLLGASIGPRLILPSLRQNKVNFQTGLVVGWGYFDQGMYGYLPLGINRLTRNNFVLSFDIGPKYRFDDEEFWPGATFKIGKAF